MKRQKLWIVVHPFTSTKGFQQIRPFSDGAEIMHNQTNVEKYGKTWTLVLAPSVEEAGRIFGVYKGEQLEFGEVLCPH